MHVISAHTRKRERLRYPKASIEILREHAKLIPAGNSMKTMLVAMGTAGDVFPFIGIGRALQRRGHTVQLASLPLHRQFVESAGLEFLEIAGVPGAAGDPDFYHPRRSMEIVANRVIIPGIRPVYELVSKLDPLEWTIVSDWFSYGARLAQEERRFRVITCIVTPFALRSVHSMPIPPGVPLPAWAPEVVRSGFVKLVARLWDRMLGPPLNAFRAQLHLAPVRDIWYNWSLSPDRVIGLFPEWFAPRAPDWPAQFRHGGYAVYDQGGDQPLPAELQQLPGPIVVFCAGSAGPIASRFFDAAVAASRGRPWHAVLLTGRNAGFSTALPENVINFPYIPLSRLLPLASAIVHHGGSGTLSLALASGVPQIVVPLGHDQYDNAARLTRLGVCTGITGKSIQPAALLKAIQDTLGNRELSARCRALAPKARTDVSLHRICDHIEAEAIPNSEQSTWGAGRSDLRSEHGSGPEPGIQAFA